MAEVAVALVLLADLGCFFSVNLINVVKFRGRSGSVRVSADVERPGGLVVGFAAAGTMIYFLEVLSYLCLVFTNGLAMTQALPLLFLYPGVSVKILGLVFTLLGTFLFIWSVVARDRYSVSWEMPAEQRLVTWGPYQYVRHPSYLGYFLMFFGFFLIWPSLLSILPWLAIPGYYHLTFEEEKLLTRRFGDEYLEYRKRTGRLLPKR